MHQAAILIQQQNGMGYDVERLEGGGAQYVDMV